MVVLGLLMLVALSALPRRREVARLASCRRNLMQVGVALELYGRRDGSLPAVPALETGPSPEGGPLRSLLVGLALPDLTELTDPAHPPERRESGPVVPRFVPGFLCPSDPRGSAAAPGDAPTSYRAATGDRPGGVNGGFAPGRLLRLGEVEAGDGKSFTAAFSERLLGDGRDAPSARNYRVVPGPVLGPECGGGPAPGPNPAGWRGDAGVSWAEAAWRSTLYNHVLPPMAPGGCVSADGRTAAVGASSGHSAGVNVLTFDGAVRTVGAGVDPRVWKALATTSGGPPDDADPAPEPH